MKKNSWPVTPENGPRPAGRPDACFYCHQPLGDEHLSTCVCRLRTVVMKVEIEYIAQEPESWDVEMIEFARNESSWCANNILEELVKVFDKNADEDVSVGRVCLCSHAKFSYVREAAKEDHDKLDLDPLE